MTPQPTWGRADVVCLAAIVAWALVWLTPNLGHPHIHNWDESIHQLVARNVHDTFFYPHLYRELLYPQADPSQWFSTDVWLTKPVGAFWASAAVMHLIGVTPLASRLVSLSGELLAAIALFALLRKLVPRPTALAVSMGFLSLPYSWILVQGYMFGDITDTTLVGWVTFAMLLVVRSIEAQSWRWSVAAGVATGVAYLCKAQLALVPLGVVLTMALLRLLQLSAGPRLPAAAGFVGALLLTAGPWVVYTARTWPTVFWAMHDHALGHFENAPRDDIGPWVRPADAIFNEVNSLELAPLPGALATLGLLWLVWRAITRRETPVVALALWLGSTWLVHSLAAAKQPNHVWNAAPAVFAAFALMATDAFRSPRLGAAMLMGLATPWFTEHGFELKAVRAMLPDVLEQTQALPGLAEGLVCMFWGASVVTLVTLWPPVDRPLALTLGVMANLSLGYSLLVKAPLALTAKAEEKRPLSLVSRAKDVGLALERLLPKKSVLWLNTELDGYETHEHFDLMFWSGRMVYRSRLDVETAKAKGYHSYVVSTTWLPLEEVAGLPPHAAFRVYDVERETDVVTLPPGVTPINATAGTMEVIGVAAGPLDETHDRWAFYVRPAGVPAELLVTFTQERGAQTLALLPEESLAQRSSLVERPWFIITTVGPPRGLVKDLRFDTQRPSMPTRW